MRRRSPQHPTHTWSNTLDGWCFALSGVAAIWFAYVLLRDGVRDGWPTLLLLVFWAFFSYLALPRLHRILTAVYLPGYFVGRTRTSDGLLGDPVNLGLLGDEPQVHGVMTRAGWALADELSLRSATNIVTSVLRRRSYPEAPVSPLHLFDHRHDFAYELEVAGNPTQRHHVRFWRCPDGWLLPGGFRTDWMAAATFDRGVGLSLFTLQVTHRIEEDTDVERDFVISTVCAALPQTPLSVIESFSSGYHHRNGGGDRIRTDGDLPILDVRDAPARPDLVVLPRPARIPQSVIVGSGIALVRAVAYAVSAVVIGVGGSDLARAVAIGIGVVAVTEACLAIAVLAGRNWARLLLVAGCTLTAGTAMVIAVLGNARPVGLYQLFAAGGSILVLLALSGQGAREYATGALARPAPAVSA